MKNKIEEILASIESLIRNNGTVDLFTQKIHNLIALAPISNCSVFEPGVEFYRSTNHHKNIPNFIDEIWFPPENFAKLSRANREGSPMFYCSADPMVSHLEIGMKPGQLAVMSKWGTIERMILHDLGYSSKVFKRAEANRSVPDMNRDFEEDHFTDVHDFIHLAFTEPVSPKYELTAAIAEVHLRAVELAGIRYPAITKKANADNISLKPEFVRSSVRLLEAQLIKVDIIDQRFNTFEGEIIADLKTISPKGELKWEFRRKELAIAPGESFTLKQGVTIIRSPAEIRVDGKDYHLEPGYSIEIPESGDAIIRDIRGELISPK